MRGVRSFVRDAAKDATGVVMTGSVHPAVAGYETVGFSPVRARERAFTRARTQPLPTPLRGAGIAWSKARSERSWLDSIVHNPACCNTRQGFEEKRGLEALVYGRRAIEQVVGDELNA